MNKTRTPSKTTSSIVDTTEVKAVATTHSTLVPSLGLVIGQIDGTCCWVTFPENPSTQAQRAAVLKHVGEVVPGQSVLLQFLSGDVTRPIVTGIVSTVDASTALSTTAPIKLEINGETLTLSAQQRITLRCGKSSLVMNADGIIEIRGTELLSRASGQNAIRGASVSIN